MPLPSTSVRWIDATLYTNTGTGQTNVNAAIAALGSGGGIVYFPPGTYNLDTTSSTIVLPSNVRLLGDGAEVSVIRQNLDLDIVHVTGNYASIERLTLMGTSGTVGGGVVVGGVPNTILFRFTMRDCVVRSTGVEALAFRGTADGSSLVMQSLVDNCEIRINRAGPALVSIGENCTLITIRNCSIDQFLSGTPAVLMTNCDGMALRDVTIEGVASGAVDSQWLAMTDCRNILVDHCWFEDDGSPATRWFVALNGHCHGITIANTTFRRRVGSDPRAISIGPSVGNHHCSVLVQNAHLLTLGGAPTGTDHIFIAGDALNEVLVHGGVAQAASSATTYPLVVNDGSARSMAFGGNSRVRLQRLSSGERDQLLYQLVGQLIWNTTTGKVNLRTASGWVGLTTTTP